MPKNSQPRPPKKKKSHTLAIVILLLVIVMLIAGTAGMIYMSLNLTKAPVSGGSHNNSFISSIFAFVNEKTGTSTPTEPVTEPEPETTVPEETETEPPETTMPEPEHVVSTATISSTGDVLMHIPIINNSRQSDGSYDFEHIFRYLNEYSSAADLAVANLETTLCGTDNGYQYSGYPNFNCPDEIVDDLKDAGFDMLLTANNHSYDTNLVGYKRTIETVRNAGLDNLGTMLTADEPKYTIQDINGIKIGMICYTYAFDEYSSAGQPSLNGMPKISEPGLCNFFTYNNLDGFYEELGGYLEEMRDAGAEATVVYMHWGIEYKLYARDQEKAIAQQLCDMGVDVIIGGHPHVVEPMDLLTSEEDPDHKTVVLYSMGNAVSNQRQGNLSSYITTAHTEDGVLFSITFSKYSDGTVYLESVDLIPCWVYMRNNKSPVEYNILPLDQDTVDDWQEKYDLSEATFNAAQRSYERTMEIVGEGLEASQEYLAEQKEQREADYLAAVMAPAA